MGSEALIAGALVFAVWMALEQFNRRGGGRSTADGLAGMPVAGRAIWLRFRSAAAVVTVPAAEELAFRGFLMRRLTAGDFESVNPGAFAIVPLAISSLAFGVLLGNRWVAGTIAGMVYGAIFLRRGSIGDAVAAHATMNALLAIWVLASGSWQLW